MQYTLKRHHDPFDRNLAEYHDWAANGFGTRYEHKQLKMIDMPFYLEEMYPRNMIAQLTRLYDKPIYITENGCSCDDDRFRIVYLALYLNSIRALVLWIVTLKHLSAPPNPALIFIRKL